MALPVDSKEELQLQPLWLNFIQDTLEARYLQNASELYLKGLANSYLLSALFLVFPALPLLFSLSGLIPLGIISSLLLLPIITAMIKQFMLSRKRRQKGETGLSISYIVFLNLCAVAIGSFGAWNGLPMSWAPVGPVIFCIGAALYCASFKQVVMALLITAFMQLVAVISATLVIESFVPQWDQLIWFGFSALPLILFSRSLNVDRRQLFMLNSQLKESEASLQNESFERRRLWQLLKQNVRTDPITRLFDQQYFLKLSQLEVERARRYQRPLSMLVARIDGFADYKSQYGVEWLNKVEMKVASLFRQQLRQQDIIGRIGNDFGVLLPEIGVNEAQIVMHRLKSVIIEQAIDESSKIEKITLLIGMGSLPNAPAASRGEARENVLQTMFNSAVAALKKEK